MHEIFGRLLTLAFGLATVVTLAYFARWLFSSPLAGILAACFYAVFPGSVYYGRTFTPDGVMVFFLTAALYASARFLLDDETLAPRPLARTAALVTLAYLAKPVAVMGILPIGVVAWQRLRAGRPTRATAIAVLLAVPLLILWLYDRRVASYAQWHWASGIVALHVLPGLRDSLAGAAGFTAKLAAFRTALGMLRQTMLGSVGFVCSVAAFGALPWIAVRSRPLLWAWLIAGARLRLRRRYRRARRLLHVSAASAVRARHRRRRRGGGRRGPHRDGVPDRAGRALCGHRRPRVGRSFQGRAAVAPYYAYDARVYRNATSLDATPGQRRARGHRALRSGRPVLHRPIRMGRGSGHLDAVRRRERNRQGRALLHLDRRQPLAPKCRSCAPGCSVFRFEIPRPHGSSTKPIRAKRFRAPMHSGARSVAPERAGNGRAFLDRTALCSVRPLQRPMPSNSRKSAANASG